MATLTLARPQVLNAISPSMIAEVRHALAQVAENANIKALVVRGQGRTFCCRGRPRRHAGGILGDTSLRSYLTGFNEALFALEELPIPTIALVQAMLWLGAWSCCWPVTWSSWPKMLASATNTSTSVSCPALVPLRGFHARLAGSGLWSCCSTGRWLTGQEAVAVGLALRAVPAEQLGP